MSKSNLHYRNHITRHAQKTSEAMRMVAKHKQCPACGRKMAIKRIDLSDCVVRQCRWCDWVRVRIKE